MDIEQQKKNMHIPPDLIEEILLRLPVKSLVRFRSLSKQCLSLTTDPKFIKSNFDLGAAPTNGLLYMTHSGSEARWVDVDSSIRHCHAVRLPVPYHHKIIDSCRGFILLEKYGWCLILWNPLTGAHKKLSYSPAASMVKGYRSRCLWRGFGYDESSDDYLIVVIWQKEYYFNDDDDFGTRCEFFSVKNNSWKEIAIAHSSNFDVSVNKYGLFFNGSIHWLGTTRIVALDLAGKCVSKIKLPDLRGHYSCDLKKFGRYLGVCFIMGDETSVWVMKEYKGHATWTKRYNIFHYGVIDPVCFTKRGELVAIKDQRCLAKFKYKGRLEELYQDGPLRQDGRGVMFTPTLLSLPVDSGNTSKDGH